MIPDLQIVNPLEIKNWDDLILAQENPSFFHSSNWARVLHYTYDYTPVYFCLMEGNELKVLFPFMEVNSWITGKRGVSLPFSDHCPLLVNNSHLFQEYLAQIHSFGKKKGWRYFEFRDNSHVPENIKVASSFYEHTLLLQHDTQPMLDSFHPTTRRNIRKGSEHDLRVAFDTDPIFLEEYYKLHCLTRKRQGIPPQPFDFFKNIHQHVLKENQGIIGLVSYKDRYIAGMFFFHFGREVIYKFGASVIEFQYLKPNNLLMWEAILWYMRKGFQRMDLGRTNLDNDGLRRYKEGWGSVRNKIHYYKYDLKKNNYISGKIRLRKLSCLFLQLCPLSFSIFLGNRLYKHAG